ncbi:MAG: hypothetical protein QXY45_03305 [Candidatus Aenigmatarchaeota archaeon]
MPKIPKDDFLYQIIRDVVRKRGIVETQEELCYLVSRRIRNYNKEFTISPKRVRKLALKIPEIRVKTITRKSITRKIIKCPVCEGKLGKIFGKNLLGKEIQIGYKCRKCGFSGKINSFMPNKYVFIWRK